MRKPKNTKTATIERPTNVTRATTPIVQVEESNPLMPYVDHVESAQRFYDALDSADVAAGKRALSERDGLDAAQRLAQSTLKRFIKIVYGAEKEDFDKSQQERIKGEQADFALAVQRRDGLAITVHGRTLSDGRIARQRVLKRDGYGTPEVLEVTVKASTSLDWSEKLTYAERTSANFQKAAAFYRKQQGR